MTKKRRSASILFFMISVLLLFTTMMTQLPQRIAYDAYFSFDPASSNMMAADILYTQQHGLDSPLVRYLYPRQELSDGTVIVNADEIGLFFAQNHAVKAEDFAVYSSNLCIQRYAYMLLDVVLPISNPAFLRLLESLNTLLMALALAGVLVWGRSVAGVPAGVVALGLLAFFSPLLTVYGSNLYWAGFSLFLPMLGSVYALHLREKQGDTRRWHRSIFWIAFAGCLLKQLLYFEFVSAMMVAMMIPYVYSELYTGLRGRVKRALRTLLWPFLGAIASFVVAFAAKIGVLWAVYGSFGQAWEMALSNILLRTHGQAALAESALQGAQSTLPEVLHSMFSAHALQLRTLFSVNFYVVTLVLVLISILVALGRKKRWLPRGRGVALVGAAWVSLLAPLSWFVLAQGHTAVHLVQSGVLFYVPYTIMVCAATIYTIEKILRAHLARRKRKAVKTR